MKKTKFQLQMVKNQSIKASDQTEPEPTSESSEPPVNLQRAIKNPHSLSHNQILQLQRTIGNQAVQRLLMKKTTSAQVPATANTAPSPGVVQRLIGFEIETGIPAKWQRSNGKTFRDPKHIEFDVNLPRGAKLGVDDNPVGGGKILEFASEPVDDTQKSSDFREKATYWVGMLDILRKNASKSPPLQQLNKLSNEAPANAHYGFMKGQQKDRMERISIQTTHGMRLDKVREYLSSLTLANPNGSGRMKSKQKAANEAAPSAEPIMSEILKRYDPKEVDGATDKQVEEFRGFLTLMTHYLHAGKYVDSGYNKNRAFLFYKSKLSDVRNKLETENNYAKSVLGDPKMISLIQLMMLIATKRKLDEPLFVKTTRPIIGLWMNSILNGTDDPGFAASKNPWGTDIKPDMVNGGMAAIVEHRDIDKVLPPPSALKLTEPKVLVNYMTTIFEANQKWQGITKEEKPGEEGNTN